MIMVLLMAEAKNFLMLRNVHPNFVDNGRVGSDGFAPSEQHDFKLSVDFNILSSPYESFVRHTELNGLPSAGVFGVTIGEFEDYKVECVADPEPANPAHALADFKEVRAVAKSKVRKTGRALAAIATKRGKLE